MTPNRFREELKRFDRALDIEFNGKKGRWEIVGRDRKNVRYLIKSIPLGEIETLGLATLQELYDCSPTKQGGAKELNRRIDRIKEEEEAEIKRKQKNAIQERLDDAWMHFQHREGTRVSLNNSGKLDDGFTVVDRRRHYDSSSGE